MSDRRAIPVANLAFDESNPRINRRDAGQREAFRILANDQDRKLATLAEDIVKFGISPADASIVVPHPELAERYIVLEGNRRLCALRALETPDALEGAVSPAALARLRQASKTYAAHPITEVDCAVLQSREAADHWIELRHTGQNDGRGVVGWGGVQALRYRSRMGKRTVSGDLLLELADTGYLPDAIFEKVPVTTFERLISNPNVRRSLGIEVEKGGTVKYLADWPIVAKALMYVVDDLASKRYVVSDFYTAEQRLEYAESLPKDIVVNGEASKASSASPSKPPVPAPATSKRGAAPRVRRILIPRSCHLTVTDTRMQNIERELRKLDIEKFPNAVSVLQRVFVEMSIDLYIARKKIAMPSKAPSKKGTSPQKPSLRNKLLAVVDALQAANQLTKGEANAVRTMAAGTSYLNPTITIMNQYVHNAALNPSATDLRAAWDNLTPMMCNIWPA